MTAHRLKGCGVVMMTNRDNGPALMLELRTRIQQACHRDVRDQPIPRTYGPVKQSTGTTGYYLSSYTLCNKIYGYTMTSVDADQSREGARKGIGRELKRGTLELIVLHLLAPGEAYGYEIVSTLTAHSDGALTVTDGTLYPVLYRLERAGFVQVRWDTPDRGVPRKYYRLTPAGRAELAQLEHEWTTFATAMAKLLRNERS